jgi:phosphatidylethanolamine-binding protein (PEBP) family uncharacterized protein
MKKQFFLITVIVITSLLSAWNVIAAAPERKQASTQVNSPSSMTALSQGDNPLRTEENLSNESRFILSSPEAVEGGMLPKEFTCDGSSSTLPLEWKGVPVGTKSLAVVMHTIPGPNESHWYWVLYNIPSDVRTLVKNVIGVGRLGNNSVNKKTEYAPPCSRGPGSKLYTYTIYALSAPPLFDVPASQVSRDVLLSAIKERILGTAELNVYYSR